MSFLFPLAAWLGLLALPVIAFYLLKTRQRRKPVSTLLFWNQLQPKIENSPLWRKLRRWLSLALQLLILALLVAALARPAFDWEQRSPQRTLVILDPSASIQATSDGTSRWDLALRHAETQIARLRMGDEMAILSAEDAPRLLCGWTASQRELRTALAEATPSSTGTNPRAAIELARELCALRENTRMEILSDSVWPLEADEAERLLADSQIVGISDASPTNTGLTHFAVRRSPVAPGEWQLDAEIVSTVPFSGLLEVFRDGEPMDRAPVETSAENPWRKSWRGNTEDAVTFSAMFVPGADDFLGQDNQATCTLAPLLPLRVVVAGLEGSSLEPFLEAVLDSIPLVQWTRMQSVPEQTPDGVDLLIAGGGQLPSQHPGCAVLLIDPAGGGFWGSREGVTAESTIMESRASSRLLRHASLNTLSIGASSQWTPAPDGEVFATTSDSPVLFGQWTRDPDTRWLVLAFDPAQSDLPLRTAFPIFIGNVLQSLRGETTEADGAALLPGAVESLLQPVVRADFPGRESSTARLGSLPVLPGWWWVLFIGLVVLVTEWILFHRRITD